MGKDTSALIAVAFAFCTWAVYLGGLAAVQNTCNEKDIYARGDGFTDRSVFDCYQLYGYYWFVMVYEFVVVMCCAILAAGGMMEEYRTSFAAMFAIGTLLFIEVSRCWIPVQSQLWFEKDSTFESRVRCVVAGAIMTAITNGVATFVIGHDKSKSEYYAAKEATKKHAPQGAEAA